MTLQDKSRRLKELQHRMCLTPLEALERKILEAELGKAKVEENLRYEAMRLGKSKVILPPDSPSRVLLDSYHADLEKLYREREALFNRGHHVLSAKARLS